MGIKKAIVTQLFLEEEGAGRERDDDFTYAISGVARLSIVLSIAVLLSVAR